VERFAACFRDRRRPELVEHSVATLVGQRVFGIALGYEVRVAIQNAASVAALLITTEAMVAEMPKKNAGAGGMPAGGGGMGGMDF
jgi:hypothetical protein